MGDEESGFTLRTSDDFECTLDDVTTGTTKREPMLYVIVKGKKGICLYYNVLVTKSRMKKKKCLTKDWSAMSSLA